ncbi:MAG: hypothetical protein WCD69_21710 [Xanthobacteraceae bacterium]
MTAATQAKWPQGIVTYELESETLARQLAKAPNPAPQDWKRLGEQLIRESTEAMEQVEKTIRHVLRP